MTHPFIFARVTPNKPAVLIAGTCEQMTYRELEASADRNAHLLRSLGLKRGDCVAAILDNEIAMFEMAWATDRAGIYFTAVSNKLTASESEYIVRDSNSKAFFTSGKIGEVADQLALRLTDIPLFMAGEVRAPYQDWKQAAAAFPATPIEDESAGGLMLYSSGTTGRPKGVKRPLAETGLLTPSPIGGLYTQLYGATADWVYLSPAPLYHAAPIGWTMTAQRTGCTVVVMEKFDAEETLRNIEKYKINIAQFVPTHFIRMLKLPEEIRNKYDLSSLKCVFHAAAPCPVPVKQAMMGWWGPIIHEYYGGTEANGFAAIGPQDWLRKRGSVGKAAGCQIYICDENGEALPANQEGQVYFAGGAVFKYHNDDEKTKQSYNQHGWSSLGDIGRLDEDGFLFLTDRKSFMIISGGVNIYPQEIENILATHPKVTDVAVVGAPDEEMGERVVAVIQAAPGHEPGPALGEELRLYCREHLSGVKVPRQFDFIADMPRHDTGKLYKRLLRDQYWAKHKS